ncbi:MAG TPA: hypothetical protein VMG08_14045 [Allosphingosinicella sp.]|nr:hypothetical protein [Allosphingosinicella sp.]
MSAAWLHLGALFGEGVELLRRRWGAVLAWTIVYLAAIAGVDLMSRYLWRLDPTGQSGALFYFLLALLLALVTSLLLTAALRALLRPREMEFASLDVGLDEARMIGMTCPAPVTMRLAAVSKMMEKIVKSRRRAKAGSRRHGMSRGERQ